MPHRDAATLVSEVLSLLDAPQAVQERFRRTRRSGPLSVSELEPLQRQLEALSAALDTNPQKVVKMLRAVQHGDIEGARALAEELGLAGSGSETDRYGATGIWLIFTGVYLYFVFY